jgi:hypothetical protein
MNEKHYLLKNGVKVSQTYVNEIINTNNEICKSNPNILISLGSICLPIYEVNKEIISMSEIGKELLYMNYLIDEKVDEIVNDEKRI